jgi:ATPase subunit of ABC transporter with duplicated ATPase domains
MISAHDINKEIEGQAVLAGLSFSLERGERVGLVGPNGSGKTTLLRIIAGVAEADRGHVEVPPGVSVAYLSQEPSLEELALTPTELLAQADGHVPDGRLAAWCARLALDAGVLARPLSTLSGGEKAKVALLRILAGNHDVYLLDEPTNNLDLAGLVYLEAFIRRSRAAFLIVSHDRKLLDRLTTRTLELDGYTHGLTSYSGAFSEYLAQRTARLEKQWERHGDYLDERERLTESARRQTQWAVRGQTSAKPTDNDKLLQGRRADRSAALAAKAKNVEKRLERLEAVEKPPERLPIKMELTMGERSGDRVFVLEGAVARVGDAAFGPVDFEVNFGERVAVIGPNGAGKSLLVRALLGELPLVDGTARVGSRVELGYLPQEPWRRLDRTVLEEFKNGLTTDEALLRRTLYRFGLEKDDMGKRLADLSPGQRSRLILAKLVERQTNCLVLDEPSNHLDLEAMGALEKALAGYAGTVIAVTHDRAFLDAFQPTRTVVVEPGWRLRTVDGYGEYEGELAGE